ncbi:hypothetical protein PIB30_055676 [Stylosanthes scabra]|uniref:Transposase (Putative), gypsy type n=1 Tax=Stylosanthes scabra TaxID=79078 RepID=A0ABU6ZHV6_9FABA|nr:hypothetical protein [Stylosanthes scabra]
MAKKKSYQNVRNPRVLSPVERELYGWVDAEVFTQSSVLTSEHLSDLRREMRLAQDPASERDFVLEAAGPSDRLPFQALEDRTHFLWVYAELFTHLGVRLPFSDFQREVLMRCRVAASQLHLNGWGFLRTFKCGRRLFNAFEESIQDFKWHYFKVLPLPGSRPFWLVDEGKPFPWVYWNSGAKECRITALHPLETLAFELLQSLLVGLEKRSNFRCRWILDRSDAEKMAEAAGVGPRSVLPHVRPRSTTSGASAFGQAVPAHTPVASPPLVPPPAAVKMKRGPFSVEREEGAKEDPAADLKRKGRKRKALEASAEEAALGADSAWEHKVSPINRAFPDDYNFWAALDAGLTNGPTREILNRLVSEQLLGTTQHLACQLTACLQVGIEKAFAAKMQMEKELSSMKDQVDVLTVERDSALAAPLLNAKIKSLVQELEVAEERERKEVENLAQSLKEKQTVLDEAEAAAAHWRDEWKSLAEETGEMAKRIYNPKAEAQEQSELVAEERLDPATGVPPGEGDREDLPEGPAGDAMVEEGGGCLV